MAWKIISLRKEKYWKHLNERQEVKKENVENYIG
jgi:hypothetical protein